MDAFMYTPQIPSHGSGELGYKFLYCGTITCQTMLLNIVSVNQYGVQTPVTAWKLFLTKNGT